MPDLRGGFSYLIAALAAEGTSRVHGIDLIERGYEHFQDKLDALGASYERGLSGQIPSRRRPTARRAAPVAGQLDREALTQPQQAQPAAGEGLVVERHLGAVVEQHGSRRRSAGSNRWTLPCTPSG